MITSENIAKRTVRRQDLPLLYDLSQDLNSALLLREEWKRTDSKL